MPRQHLAVRSLAPANRIDAATCVRKVAPGRRFELRTLRLTDRCSPFRIWGLHALVAPRAASCRHVSQVLRYSRGENPTRAIAQRRVGPPPRCLWRAVPPASLGPANFHADE